jgi:hypothetical protein
VWGVEEEDERGASEGRRKRRSDGARKREGEREAETGVRERGSLKRSSAPGGIASDPADSKLCGATLSPWLQLPHDSATSNLSLSPALASSAHAVIHLSAPFAAEFSSSN